jgi:type VI secretion system protein ImpJ
MTSDNYIQWHEGMLLSPHHFQQFNNYIQHWFGQLGAANFCYGVYELKLDTSALASGVIRLLKVRGIFQDGYGFDFDAMRDRALERNLGEYFLSHRSSTKIYLAIPARRDGENQLSGDMARYYSAEITNVADENTGENAMNIPILKPSMKLLLDGEVDARYVSFPIFEAEKSVDGGIVGTNFIAPHVVLDEHSKISEMCRDVLQLLRNKIAYFSDRRDNYARNVTDESMANLRLLIQAALPLESIIGLSDLRPFEIFGCLLEATAKIISVNPTQLIPRLPTYDHLNLFATFDGLLRYVKNILGEMRQQYDIMRFEKDGPMFKLQMKKEWLEKDEISIGIMKTFAASEGDVLAWINGLQIASESMIPLLRDRRVLGAERSILERGAYITQPVGMKILSVKTKSAYIKPSEKLCLVNGAQPTGPEEVVLYADC